MSKLVWLLFFNSYIFIFLSFSLFSFFGHAAQQVGSQFSDQGSNLCSLHWKLEFQPIDHQGSPKTGVADSWVRKTPGEGIGYPLQYSWASHVAQLVKNPPAMQETWVRPLGWEDPLEKGKATYSSILENCMDCIVHGVTGGIKNSFFFFSYQSRW